MSKRTLLLLIGAVIAAFTALSVKNRLAQAPAPVPVVQQASMVLIAKHDLSPGNFVQAAQDLDWGPLPAQSPKISQSSPPPSPADANAPAAPDVAVSSVKVIDETPKETYLYENAVKLNDFNGAVVRRMVHAGEPVPASALMKAGSGGLLSAVLNPGMRAVSISVTPTSGNAGFVLPGDFIDLIVTREINRSINNGRESEQRKIVFSKIFVQDVRVLAVDQMLDNPENKALLAKTVTVEVSPTQAQEIAVAAELGKISVSLRSAVKIQTPEEEKAEAEELARKSVSDADMAEPQTPDVSEQVKMFRPKETQNLEFYQTHSN